MTPTVDAAVRQYKVSGMSKAIVVPETGPFERKQTPSAAWPDVADAIRRTMKANKGKDTKPELALRSMLHGGGYRFRVHGRHLPGTPDVVFGARRKVVCVHGCFWHSHPGCRYATVPKTRADFWIPKLARNRERDTMNTISLVGMGWASMVVWECEMRDPERVRGRLSAFLGPTRHRVPGRSPRTPG